MSPSSTVYSTRCFFHDTPTTEIYTLSLHDALPISGRRRTQRRQRQHLDGVPLMSLTPTKDDKFSFGLWTVGWQDRKSTRLNSSHSQISYAVFCLKKKTEIRIHELKDLSGNRSESAS